jgi:predicted nucleic acid-binding protein
MRLVLDSSVTLAWLYSEETTVAVQRVMDLVTDSGAWVPAIWRLEVANSLQTGVRRGRINSTIRDESLADLERWTL